MGRLSYYLPCDVVQLGNTGGLGGIFGLFYAIGSPLPFPEANPWKMSKRYRFFNWITTLRSN